MAPGEMCLLFIPRVLYEQLCAESTARGMSLAALLATSVDRYLNADSSAMNVAPRDALDENVASFHFTPAPAPVPRVAVDPSRPRPKTKLQGFG
jgi:hypothetical protein